MNLTRHKLFFVAVVIFSFLLLPHTTYAALSIDGTPAAGTEVASSALPTGTYVGDCCTDPNGTLTTSNGNDVIVVSVLNENGSSSYVTVSSVTATGLTFTLRDRKQYATPGGAYADYEIWYAVASSPFSGLITANFSSASYEDSSIEAFAVSGANTSSPWDVNASLPTTSTIGSTAAAPSVSGVSTTASNTMLLMFNGSADLHPISPVPPDEFGTGNTWLNPGLPGGDYWGNENGACSSFQTNVYEVVSSAQSNVTMALGADNGYKNTIAIVDAIQASSQPFLGRIIRIIGGTRLIGGIRLGGSSPVPTCAYGFTNIASGNCREFITTTGAGTFTVPSNWNSSNNTIEVIGGGGGGAGSAGSSNEPGGGGGGGYSEDTDITVSSTIYYSVGAAGTGGSSGSTPTDGGTGGDTWIRFDGTNAAPSTSAQGVLAKGGTGGQTYFDSAGGIGGGQAGNTGGVGTVLHLGENGGTPSNNSWGGSGGGGAGGPRGNGGTGGNDDGSFESGGSGGGGAGGGASGTNGDNGTEAVTGQLNGTAGGNNAAGSGSGGGGALFTNGTAGSNGGGGGGGGGVNADNETAGNGAVGGAGSDWGSYGPGGGGGGGAGNSFNGVSAISGAGGNGGGYGGGGGGGGGDDTSVANSGVGGNGAQGIIVITYHP